MVDKKARKKCKPDKDTLVKTLRASPKTMTQREMETDMLRQEILSDAEIVTRWKKRSFYIS